MTTTPTAIERLLIIPKANGSYLSKPLPSTAAVQAKDANGNPEVTAQLDTNGTPVTYTQTNPDGTTTTNTVMVPVMETVTLSQPKVSGLAFVVDVPLPTTPTATNATVAAAMASFKAAHASLFPSAPATA